MMVQALARRDFRRDKVDSKYVYDLFNMGIVGSDNDKRDELNKNFYEALKKQGYGAVRDVNDARYSGYRSKDPLIFFDTAKVATTKVSELSNSEINKKNVLAVVRAQCDQPCWNWSHWLCYSCRSKSCKRPVRKSDRS